MVVRQIASAKAVNTGKFADYPKALGDRLYTLDSALAVLMYLLQEGKISLNQWKEAHMTALGSEMSGAFASGYGVSVEDLFGKAPEAGNKKKIRPGDRKTALQLVASDLAKQAKFFAGFALVMAGWLAQVSAGKITRQEVPWTALQSRQRSYATGIVASFWKGKTLQNRLPLPAVPGDGTSQCLQNDRCRWRIEKLAGENNWDCYWELDPTCRHCQTCLERRRRWYPYRIRNGQIDMPMTGTSAGRERVDIGGGHYRTLEYSEKGGEGSGFFGHAGRPGEVGGVSGQSTCVGKFICLGQGAGNDTQANHSRGYSQAPFLSFDQQ